MMSDTSDQITFQISVYSRTFVRPLKAAWGEWTSRKGVLIRVSDQQGNSGYGEVAPMKAFGSENLNEALQFLASIPSNNNLERLGESMAQAPAACAFGIWSAISDLSATAGDRAHSGTAGLVSLGYNLEKRVRELKDLGFHTFKIKVGMRDPNWERSILHELMEVLDRTDRIRLDPNRAWDLHVLENWSTWLSGYHEQIEFIEEPLSTDQLSRKELVKIATDFPIPLALDESLSESGITPWLDLGWPGYWIMKPSIQGIPDWLEKLPAGKVILSSIFETGIGQSAILSLTGTLPPMHHGLGTSWFFKDGLSLIPQFGNLTQMGGEEKANIWHHFFEA